MKIKLCGKTAFLSHSFSQFLTVYHIVPSIAFLGFIIVNHLCPKYCIMEDILNSVYIRGRNTVQK